MYRQIKKNIKEMTKAGDVGDRTRGVKIKEKTGSKEGMPSEFFEHKLVVRT
ncbi:MAG: hypothetical protein HY096_01720 [Nitrospinae bacterium]|nr:hypothetical protein [Nitrospinota bacterium]